MKSKIVDYICEPNNYKIEITDSTYGVVTVVLFIGKKPTLYRKYRCETIDYDVGNELVKKFCRHLEEEKLKLFGDEEMYIEIVKTSLKKVFNRLGLLIWKKN